MRHSLVLLPQSSAENVDTVGCPVRGAGWYAPNAGYHTVSISAQNYRGWVVIEASLVASPGDPDWFAIQPPGYSTSYIDYPRSGRWSGETSTIGWAFTCNCLWVRARLQRSHFIAPGVLPANIAQYGSVDAILLKY